MEAFLSYFGIGILESKESFFIGAYKDAPAADVFHIFLYFVKDM